MEGNPKRAISSSVSTTTSTDVGSDGFDWLRDDFNQFLEQKGKGVRSPRKTTTTTAGVGRTTSRGTNQGTVRVPAGEKPSTEEIERLLASRAVEQNSGSRPLVPSQNMNSLVAQKRQEVQTAYNETLDKLSFYDRTLLSPEVQKRLAERTASTDFRIPTADELTRYTAKAPDLSAGETPEALQSRLAELEKQLAKTDYMWMEELVQEQKWDAMREMGKERKQVRLDRFRDELAGQSTFGQAAGYAVGSLAGGVSDVTGGVVSAVDAILPNADIQGNPVQYPGLEKLKQDKALFEELVGAQGSLLPEGVRKWTGNIARGIGYSLPSTALAFVPGGGTALSFAASAVPMYGNSYAEAIKEGATEEQAQYYAILNGLLGAAVETGFGVQKFAGGSKGLLKAVVSTLEEGGEEVVQGWIDGLSKKAIYDKEKEWASLTDPTAVFNPYRSLEEFASGVLVGGLLSGGPAAVQQIQSYTQAKAVGQTFLDGENGSTLEDALAIGLSNAKGTDAYKAAEVMSAKVKKGESVSAYAVGRMLLESTTPKAQQARELEAQVRRSGERLGVSKDTADAVAAVAVALEQNVAFVAPEELAVTGAGGKTNHAAGRYLRNSDQVLLNSRVREEELIGHLLAHELTHSAEGTALWQELADTVRQERGEGKWRADIQEMQETRRHLGDNLDEDRAAREVVAAWIADNLFDGDFIRAVITGKATTGNAVLRTLDTVRRALGQRGGRPASRIAMMERMFMRALESKRSAAVARKEKNSEAIATEDEDSYRLRQLVEMLENGEAGSQKSSKKGKCFSFLSDKDIPAYLRAGTRRNKKKLEAYQRGEKIVLTSNEEVEHFVETTLDNPNNGTTVGYGRVEARLQTDVLAETQGKVNLSNFFLEIVPSDIQHSYLEHKRAKEPGDIDLSREDFKHFAKYLGEYDEVAYVQTYDSGSTKVCVSKKIPRGRVVIIEVVSNSRGALQFKNMIGMTEQKYQKTFVPKHKKSGNVSSARGSKSSNTSLRNNTKATNTTIPQDGTGVNTQYTQNGQKNAQNAFLPEEFAGVEEYRPEAPGVDVVATEEMGQPNTVFRSQMQTAEQSDSTAKTVAKGQTLEELAAELGDRELNRRMYMAMQIDRPPATVTVDGVEFDTATYLETVERQLPDTREDLEAYIADAEQRLQAAAVEAYTEGDIDRIAGLPVNLQLFAARRKLEMELAPGENGSKVRRFFEQRLKGTDVNQRHNAELMEFLAGRSETYSPISNQATLNKAQEYLRKPGNAEKLVKRLGRDNPRDLFNEVEMAAAEVLINDARNDGDMELYADLAQALSRKGTAAGRAVQILAMQAKLTPEGTIRAAQRLLQKETDRVHGDGVSKAISDMAGTLAEASEAATEAEETRTPLGNVNQTEDVGGGTNPPSRSVNRPKRTLTPEEAQEIVERAVKAKIEDVPQLRRWLTRKDIQMELAGRIARLVNEGTLNDAAMERAFREVLNLPVLTTEDVGKLVELVGAMQAAEEGTTAHTDAVLAIYEFLGSKLPVSRLEALQSWRKFAMLFNLKTHIRNLVSNGAMYYGINRADAAIDTLFQRWLLDASAQTARLGWSHTEQGRALMPTIERAAERAVQKKRLGGGKYDVASSTLGRHKTYFKWDWLNRLSGWNSSLLERADLYTFRKAYTDALGQIMVARGLTEVTEDIDRLAYGRATDTVFQTDNAINDVLVTLKNYVNSDKAGMRVLGHAVDVVIPFTKTPANIATQSINHSPLGIAKAAFQFYKATQSGTAQQKAEAIHTLSQGLTGTALLAVGLLLGSLGLFTTGFGKTEKERAADELAGRQQNSLQIGGVSITLDWLQPAAAPLIVGASIAQRLREDGLSLGSVFGAVMDGTDSLFELSMLQSLYDILGGYDTGVSATLGSVAENLVSQSIPTLVGQVARTIDPVQRKTTGDNDFETVLNKVLAKIPGLTYLLEPELDIWGNEVYRTGKPGSGSALLNAAQQFALPWNTKIAVGDDDMSREILRLYQTQGAGALPSSLTRDQAKDHGLDYTDTNRELGAVLEEAILQFFRDEVAYTVQVELANGKKKAVSKTYSDMTDEERRRVIGRISTKAKAQYTDDEADDAYFLT